MLELLPLERYLFLAILIISLVSSIFAYVQIRRANVRFRRLLVAFTSVQITLGAVLLIQRAVAIQAFPITGVFESMLILMVFVGITFLFLSAFLQQVWFLSVMAWTLAAMIVLSLFVAKPAATLQEAARTPWVIVHAISMSLSGAIVVFAAVMSVLFLWSRRCLKNNQFQKLFGRMPNLEKLQLLNVLGLRLGFFIMTFGLVTGIGLVAVSSVELGMTFSDWLSDSKIVLIGISWLLLLSVLVLGKLFSFSGKMIAVATLTVCFLILFAFIGSQVLCKSDHNFTNEPQTSSYPIELLYADSTGWH